MYANDHLLVNYSTMLVLYFPACTIPGYYGSSCNISCAPGTFGFRCAGNCSGLCPIEKCHPVFGCTLKSSSVPQTIDLGTKLLCLLSIFLLIYIQILLPQIYNKLRILWARKGSFSHIWAQIFIFKHEITFSFFRKTLLSMMRFIRVTLFLCLLLNFLFLFGGFRQTWEFFIHMKTSPLPVNGCKFRPMFGAHGYSVLRVF